MSISLSSCNLLYSPMLSPRSSVLPFHAFPQHRHIIERSPKLRYAGLSEANFPQNRKDIYGTPLREEERDGQRHTTIDAFLVVFLFDSTQEVNYTRLQ